MSVINPYRFSAGGGGLLLDDYTSANVAFSFRLLNSSYAGFCIKVRRSSDNATQDIDFALGVLDTVSLLSFVGANDGFIDTWYDQSGNSKNATQTTITKQPKLVTSGVLEIQGGKPACLFTNPTTQMLLNHTLPTPFGFLAVVHPVYVAPGGSIIANRFYTSMTATKYSISAALFLQYRRIATNQSYASIKNNGDNIMVINADNIGNSQVYESEISNITTTGQETTTTVGDSVLGGFGTSRLFNGHMQEIVFWHNDKSADILNISANANSHYSYY